MLVGERLRQHQWFKRSTLKRSVVLVPGASRALIVTTALYKVERKS